LVSSDGRDISSACPFSIAGARYSCPGRFATAVRQPRAIPSNRAVVETPIW
jgi:hypothetical protein